ncbi:MAG: amidohydrolase family protein [Janthinobacterium lividum]
MSTVDVPPVSLAPLAGVRNARLPDGGLVDLTFAAGVVIAVDHAGLLEPAHDVLDLDGRLLLPAGVEPHTHLDKALSFDAIRPTYGGLADGIRQWQAYARTIDEDDFVRRGRAAALELLSNGVTAIRTHAEVFPSADPLVAVRAMVRVRESLAGLLDLEIAVLAKPEIADEVVEESIRIGADLVGGSPHNTADPRGDLERLLAIARRTGVGIDIHADERLDPRSLTVRDLAAAVTAEPLSGTVTAGHCVSLGVMADPLRSEVARELAAAAVGVVTCPVTNLYLQGRDHPVGMPRGLTATRALLDAGVTLAGAGDNIRDPLNPVGAADPLATAALLVAAGHLTVEESLDAVTRAGRVVMGLAPAGAIVGGAADFLAVRASSLDDAVSRLMHDRVVIHAGALVSRRTSELTVAGTP